jgi:hypothetical protein
VAAWGRATVASDAGRGRKTGQPPNLLGSLGPAPWPAFFAMAPISGNHSSGQLCNTVVLIEVGRPPEILQLEAGSTLRSDHETLICPVEIEDSFATGVPIACLLRQEVPT